MKTSPLTFTTDIFPYFLTFHSNRLIENHCYLQLYVCDCIHANKGTYIRIRIYSASDAQTKLVRGLICWSGSFEDKTSKKNIEYHLMYPLNTCKSG